MVCLVPPEGIPFLLAWLVVRFDLWSITGAAFFFSCGVL